MDTLSMLICQSSCAMSLTTSLIGLYLYLMYIQVSFHLLQASQMSGKHHDRDYRGRHDDRNSRSERSRDFDREKERDTDRTRNRSREPIRRIGGRVENGPRSSRYSDRKTPSRPEMSNKYPRESDHRSDHSFSHSSSHSSRQNDRLPATQALEGWDPIKEAEQDPAWARIYISNLPDDVTIDELQEIFGAIGIVAREKQKRGFKDQWPFKIKMYTDEAGKFKGDAVLTYEDANAARTAPSFFNGSEIRGKAIKVELAGKPEPPAGGWTGSTGGRRGGGRGGGGRGGYGGISSIMSGKETGLQAELIQMLSLTHHKVTKAIQCEQSFPSQVRPSVPNGSSPERKAKETPQNLSPKAIKTLSSETTQKTEVEERENHFLSPEKAVQVQERTLRQRKRIRYIEPSLKTKLRQGRYYGLLWQTPPAVYRRRAPKKRNYASQRQTFRVVRQSRAHPISYAEPKLNTKLRQIELMGASSSFCSAMIPSPRAPSDRSTECIHTPNTLPNGHKPPHASLEQQKAPYSPSKCSIPGSSQENGAESVDLSRFMEHQNTHQQLIRHCSVLLAGGIAGSIGKTITAPLSRLTILFQVHSMVSSRHRDRYSDSVSSALLKVLKTEGVLALWKGNGASVVHRFPYSAVNFFTFELLRTSIDQWKQETESDTTEELGSPGSWKTTFLSGAIAGAFATIACYPIDLIRTRLATQLDTEKRYNGILHAAFRIRADEGFRGLYRGLGATLMVTVPNLAINFTLFESLKEVVIQYRSNQNAEIDSFDANCNEEDLDFNFDDYDELQDSDEDDERLGIVDTLLCGGVSGIASSLVTFPIDVVRRRLQISGIHSTNPSGLFTIASQLYKEQGVSGFYRGLTPELMKVIPMVGITFGMFDKLKDWMDID
uniref:Mitochondrial Carrier (MC) Family putative n=1 Tax=Albugo laibachii Nc14 TaxID=890382 RepID=F0WPX7_9STRA|nr:Mitochondrial Carrier (MC) Family putative [Albugo laibachii Nc14]|eukprot:CCA23378.1 Mitochondrial Carrier (MC) Family putative [Albugo laibachii Nc14]